MTNGTVAFLSSRCPQCHTSLPCVETPLVASSTESVLTWLIDAIHGRWPSAQDALTWAVKEGVIRHE